MDQSKRQVSRTRLLSAVAIFGALALVLRASPLRIPAPFAPFLIFEVWEVPIVIALIIYGFRVGWGVGILVLLAGMAIRGGPLPVGSFYNFIAYMSMMVGIIMGRKISVKFSGSSLLESVLATVFGIIVRVGVMAPLMAILMPQPFPLGFSIPPQALGATITAIISFNTILALYTVPLAYAFKRPITAIKKF